MTLLIRIFLKELIISKRRTATFINMYSQMETLLP